MDDDLYYEKTKKNKSVLLFYLSYRFVSTRIYYFNTCRLYWLIIHLVNTAESKAGNVADFPCHCKESVTLLA